MTLNDISDLVDNLQHRLAANNLQDLVADFKKAGFEIIEDMEQDAVGTLIRYISLAALIANEEADKLDCIAAKLDRIYRDKDPFPYRTFVTRRREMMDCAASLALAGFKDLQDSLNQDNNPYIMQSLEKLQKSKDFIGLCTMYYKEYLENMEEEKQDE